jgi:hypothetical protein
MVESCAGLDLSIEVQNRGSLQRASVVKASDSYALAQSWDKAGSRANASIRQVSLKGFSGCEVVLTEVNDWRFVRKTSAGPDYNARLRRQAEKQKSYCDGLFFSAARVLGEGVTGRGLAFLDMEYVPGPSAADVVEKLPLAEIPRFSESLASLAEAPADGELPPELFHAKIDALRQQFRGQAGLQKETLASLEFLGGCNWSRIPRSCCHGDATLENMIVHDGRIYLIDFLDSFAESWYVDGAKVLQDLWGLWSFRHRKCDRNMLLRLAAVREGFIALLEKKAPGCMFPIVCIYALNLLRIIPYCATVAEQAFVEHRLCAVMKYIASS